MTAFVTKWLLIGVTVLVLGPLLAWIAWRVRGGEQAPSRDQNQLATRSGIGYHPVMGTSVMRWVVMGVSLLVVGPILAWIARLAPGAESGGVVTPLTSSSMVMGVAVWLVISALAGAWGVAVSHVLSWRMALAASGAALVWCAWGTARLDDIVRTAEGASPAWRMGFDALIVALPVTLFGMYTLRNAQPIGEEHEHEDANPALIGIAITAFAIAALAASWVIARDGHQGQTIAAAIIGGIGGGAAARGFASKLRPKWFLLAVPVTLLIVPVIGGLATGADLVEHVYAGTGSPWLRVMPIDWIAGVLIGLPVGVAQADSVVHKQHPELHAGNPVS